MFFLAPRRVSLRNSKSLEKHCRQNEPFLSKCFRQNWGAANCSPERLLPKSLLAFSFFFVKKYLGNFSLALIQMLKSCEEYSAKWPNIMWIARPINIGKSRMILEGVFWNIFVATPPVSPRSIFCNAIKNEPILSNVLCFHERKRNGRQINTARNLIAGYWEAWYITRQSSTHKHYFPFL